jgi:phosphate starvation-inducible membrane PsiE
VVGAAQLKAVSLSIFPNLPASAVFQTVVFTMPLAETLFFRGAFQGTRGLLFTTVAASLWTMLLFFPSMNVVQYPLVALIFSIFFAFANFVYSYLRSRFGIYAAWSCQVAINLSLLFLCRFIS